MHWHTLLELAHILSQIFAKITCFNLLSNRAFDIPDSAKNNTKLHIFTCHHWVSLTKHVITTYVYPLPLTNDNDPLTSLKFFVLNSICLKRVHAILLAL